MSKKHVVIIAVTGIICLVSATAFVGLGICQSAETKAKAAAGTAAPVKINNTICPVMGNAVDMKNPVTVEYNGKIYKTLSAIAKEITGAHWNGFAFFNL